VVLFFFVELLVELVHDFVDAVADQARRPRRIGKFQMRKTGRAGEQELHHLLVIGVVEKVLELGAGIVGSDDHRPRDAHLSLGERHGLARLCRAQDEVVGQK